MESSGPDLACTGFALLLPFYLKHVMTVKKIKNQFILCTVVSLLSCVS